MIPILALNQMDVLLVFLQAVSSCTILWGHNIYWTQSQVNFPNYILLLSIIKVKSDGPCTEVLFLSMATEKTLTIAWRAWQNLQVYGTEHRGKLGNCKSLYANMYGSGTAVFLSYMFASNATQNKQNVSFLNKSKGYTWFWKKM